MNTRYGTEGSGANVGSAATWAAVTNRGPEVGVVAGVAGAHNDAILVNHRRDWPNAVKRYAFHGLHGDFAVHVGDFLRHASGNKRIV